MPFPLEGDAAVVSVETSPGAGSALASSVAHPREGADDARDAAGWGDAELPGTVGGGGDQAGERIDIGGELLAADRTPATPGRSCALSSRSSRACGDEPAG
jgi:hypothetical protein